MGLASEHEKVDVQDLAPVFGRTPEPGSTIAELRAAAITQVLSKGAFMVRGSHRDCRADVTLPPVFDILNPGHCEPLKAGVHGVLLATVAVCAAYNAAAWLKRRQRHLAVNFVIYGAAVLFERRHVQQHLAACEPREQLRLVSRTGTGLSDAA